MAQRGHLRRPPGPLGVRSAELAEHLQRHGQPAEVTGPPRPAPPSDLEYRPWTWPARPSELRGELELGDVERQAAFAREWHADSEAP